MVYDWLMSVLGRAFINVHADMRPFRDDLKRDLKIVTDIFEASINQALSRQLGRAVSVTGKQLGDQLGNSVTQGMSRQFARKDNPMWLSLISSLAGTIDRGISALPMEVKAAIVLGGLAASPLLAGALSAAVGAGLAVGFAGIGLALASQFETVQRQGTVTFRNIRLTALDAAGAFEAATLRALAMFENRFAQMAPKLRNIFDVAASFVDPLTDAVADAMDILLDIIEDVIGDTGPFVDELGNSIRTLALAAGAALEILVSTGDDGKQAFRDLTTIVAGLVVGFSLFLKILTHTYGVVRDLVVFVNSLPAWVQVLTPPLALLGLMANASDETAANTEQLGNANQYLQQTTTGVVAATEQEVRELKMLSDALGNAADATLDAIQSNVDFERSLDDLREALADNGRTLDTNTEKGRRNVEAFISGLRDATKAAQDRVATGELTQQQALALYDQEIARLKEVARQAGIGEEQFNELFGAAIEFNRLSIAPDHSGLSAAGASAQNLAQWLRESIELAKHLAGTIGGGAMRGALAKGFSEGGIITEPTMGVMGEGGKPEVIIPLTKPARAAQLARESGLTQMLGMGDMQVLVFIGDEPLETKMVKVVHRSNSAQSLAMAHGSRRF